MTDETGEKEHEPTPRKLEDARRRGEVVRSPELAVAAGYVGMLAISAGGGATLLKSFGAAGIAMLERADGRGTLAFEAITPPRDLLLGALLTTLPFLIAPGLAVLAILLAQRAIVVAPEKLRPRLSRISPIANAAQKYGRSGLFEFAKSSVKLMVVSAFLAMFLADRLPSMLLAQGTDATLVAAEIARVVIDFLFLVLAISAVVGVADYLWQRHEHLRRNRMSRQELIDELKQAEGDPHVKGQRRQRAEAIAMNRMLADVPKADVVIVNPTHYAVALRWNRSSGRAPICVAKGVDEIAARIREAAVAAGVPLHPDPLTARALYATVAIGREISPDHYAPVAAAIRFAERMRRRARERCGR